MFTSVVFTFYYRWRNPERETVRVFIGNVFCTKYFYHVLSPPSVPPRSSPPIQLHVIALKIKEKKIPNPKTNRKMKMETKKKNWETQIHCFKNHAPFPARPEPPVGGEYGEVLKWNSSCNFLWLRYVSRKGQVLHCEPMVLGGSYGTLKSLGLLETPGLLGVCPWKKCWEPDSLPSSLLPISIR